MVLRPFVGQLVQIQSLSLLLVSCLVAASARQPSCLVLVLVVADRPYTMRIDLPVDGHQEVCPGETSEMPSSSPAYSVACLPQPWHSRLVCVRC